MGIIRWFLRRERIAGYIAKSLPAEIVERTETYIHNDGNNKSLIRGLETNNGYLERKLGVREVELDEAVKKVEGYEQRVVAMESSLGDANARVDELNVTNENLRNEADRERKEKSLMAEEEKKARQNYLGRLKTASYFLRLARERAIDSEETCSREIERVERERRKDIEGIETRIGKEYREDLAKYDEAFELTRTRADESRRQQLFLKGALTRMEREIGSYLSFLLNNFGAESNLTKVVGVVLDRELIPIYATPKFLEISGVAEKELYEARIPQLTCSLKDHNDKSRIKYKDLSGKEHYGTIYVMPINNRAGELIGTFIQIDQSFMDKVRETFRRSGKRFNLIDFISGNSAELSGNI